MKICILSNSHGAALKAALDTMSKDDLGGAEITIFAAPKHGMGRLEPDASGTVLGTDNPELAKMLAVTSGGAETVDLAAFDGFVLHGLFLIPPRFDARQSAALRAAAVRDMLATSDAPVLARMVRGASTAPMVISPEPLPADLGMENARRPSNPPRDPAPYDDICTLIETQFDVPDVHWLWQPAQTLGERLSTPQAFSTGSTKLNAEAKAHKHIDVRHMNAEYGRIVLQAAIARMRALMQPA